LKEDVEEGFGYFGRPDMFFICIQNILGLLKHIMDTLVDLTCFVYVYKSLCKMTPWLLAASAVHRCCELVFLQKNEGGELGLLMTVFNDEESIQSFNG